MNNSIKTCGVAMLSGLLMISLSGAIWAGGDRQYRGGHDSGYSHRGYSRGYGYSKHGYPARPYQNHKRRHHNNDDDDEQLFIGLLMGGLLGYAVGNSQGREATGYYPPATTLPAPNPEYYPAPSSNSAYQHDTCLQEREYQTTVTVGGRQVEAYGTACLQPDGSWRRGPAQMAAY